MSASVLDRRPGGVIGAVRQHPLIAFFTLANGMSWLAWLPYLLSKNGLGLLEFSFPSLLGTTQLAGVLPGAYLGPVTAAFLVTAATEGRQGLKAWRGRLLRFRVRWTWWLGVALGVPAAILAATFVLPGAASAFQVVTPLVLLAYVPMLLVQIVTTALAEEPGWRDFALPRLQGRFGPLAGTVVLGLLWGGWHLPLFLTEWGGFPNAAWYQPVLFVASCVPLSIVMTWVFNRTNQSVPLIMLLHAGINSTYTLLWPAFFPKLALDGETYVVQLIATVAGTVVLLIATRGRLGLPTRTPASAPTRQTSLVR